MKPSNFIWFTGLWLYLIIGWMAYQFLTGIADYEFVRIPDWAYPVFIVIVPLIVPAVVTVTNIQRQKHGHKNFGFMDAIGMRKVDPYETQEYFKASYPPIDKKFIRRSPCDLVIGKKSKSEYIAFPLSRDGIVGYLIGGTGSGKSSVIKAILYTILYSKKISELTGIKQPKLRFNVFLCDIKGEHYTSTLKINGHYRAEENSKFIVFQPSNRDSWGWDVFYKIHRPGCTETEKIKAVSDIADALVQESGDNPFFPVNAKKILRGVMLHFIDKGWDFIPIIQKLMRTPLNNLLSEIVEEAEATGEWIVLDLLQGFVGKEGNESIQDVEATLKSYLDVFSYPDIVYALRDNPYRTSPSALDDVDEVSCLDLAIEQAFLLPLQPIFRLVVMQVLRHCEGYHESDERNTLLIIDEASRVGEIPDLDGMCATLRSKHVGILMAFQDQHQFLDIYKEHRAKTILGLAEFKAFLSGSGDEETIKYVSTMCGKYVAEKQSYKKGGMIGGQQEVKYNEDLRDIVDARAMMSLREKREVIGFFFGKYQRFKRVEYFNDPILGPIYHEIETYNKQHMETQETADEDEEQED